jgi:hypothetical protein
MGNMPCMRQNFESKEESLMKLFLENDNENHRGNEVKLGNLKKTVNSALIN